MSELSNWDSYQDYIQGGLKDGQFATGQFVLIAAGPPHLSNFGTAGAGALGAGGDVVYPIGLTQNVALSHNRAFSRIFEIGSERSYFIPGRTIGQLTLARVYYHGPSLLRVLYAYYNDAVGDVNFQNLFENVGATSESLFPYVAGGTTPEDTTGALHNVRIPPGYENLFINLASDLFSQPIGLLLVIRDSSEMNLGAVYLEQCYIPTHTFAVDSQGLIIQESVGVQFERLVPLRTNAITLLRGLDLHTENPFASPPQTSL